MGDAPGTIFSVLRTSQTAFAALAIGIALTTAPALTQVLASGEGCSECYPYLENPSSEHTSDTPFMSPSSGHETDTSTTHLPKSGTDTPRISPFPGA